MEQFTPDRVTVCGCSCNVGGASYLTQPYEQDCEDFVKMHTGRTPWTGNKKHHSDTDDIEGLNT